jgi:hypothetical protein
MLVSFKKLAPQSKIWIYQSGKILSEEEKEFVTQKTEAFIVDWTAHGHTLEAGVEILYDQFIIIGVNEDINDASGCSIDKSVNHIRELESALNVDLLDRSKVAIMQNGYVKLIGFSEIKNMVSQGVINSETEVFNNAIVSKSELEPNWLQPVANSWLKRYFPN